MSENSIISSSQATSVTKTSPASSPGSGSQCHRWLSQARGIPASGTVAFHLLVLELDEDEGGLGDVADLGEVAGTIVSGRRAGSARCLRYGLLVDSGEAVPSRVGSLVDVPAAGVRVEPGNRFLDTLRKRLRRQVSRNELTKL